MSLFNKGKTGILVAVFVVLFLTALATKCHSAEGVSFSSGTTILRAPTPTIHLDWSWPAIQSSDAHWETGITIFGSRYYKGHHNESTFALSAVYVDGWHNWDIGIGPAFLQNTTSFNHSGINFHLLLGYHRTILAGYFKQWFIRENHYSNMGTMDPNLGTDFLVVGVTF